MRHLILSLPIALAACATTGPSDRIAINAVSGGQPLPGTSCVVSTNSGSWKVVTPGAVTIADTNGDLHVVCSRAGYRTSEMIFKPASPYGSGMGLGIGGGSGGHVGVGLGLSLPISLGGSGYPAQVTVELHQQ